jgi:hypothetical protein
MQASVHSVAALAGRRVDSENAEYQRFPESECVHVAKKLLNRFYKEKVKHLVCSAACGADILALEAAEKACIPTTIVLPFDHVLFRKLSVSDRPGDWGQRYDQLIKKALNTGNLIELECDNDPSAFLIANKTIIKTAKSLKSLKKLAFVVWEGKSRGESDYTADFLRLAKENGFEKKSVLTLRRST